jgi:flagella synthesis protein FlgN
MSHSTIEAIQTMVAKDHSISQQLLDLLKTETLSIQQRDYDSVKKILLSKVPLLDQLQKHAELRKQWLISLHKIADEQHWREFLTSFNIPEVSEQWDTVNQTIESCKTINNTNGVLISRSNKTHTQLLRLLKGGATQDTLYTAKGNKQATSAYHTVAKA